MTDPVDMTQLLLRRIQTGVDALRADSREIKSRLGILEQQYASVSIRIDRIDERADRIERRLERVDLPLPAE